jgi:hypothetical protein
VKVKRKTKPTTNGWGSLKPGDVFEHVGLVFLFTNRSNNGYRVCVNMETGYLSEFLGTDQSGYVKLNGEFVESN